jgi:biopolymer transport protein ExbD
MRALRRSQHDFRIEIMPLIDVIFLLLTFFIYAMVLMIRADIVPMELGTFASGEPAKPQPAITISLDERGALFIDRAPVELDELVERLRAELEEQPGAAVYLAAAKDGEGDRLPTFLAVYDRLALEGLDLRLVGLPEE